MLVWWARVHTCTSTVHSQTPRLQSVEYAALTPLQHAPPTPSLTHLPELWQLPRRHKVYRHSGRAARGRARAQHVRHPPQVDVLCVGCMCECVRVGSACGCVQVCAEGLQVRTCAFAMRQWSVVQRSRLCVTQHHSHAMQRTFRVGRSYDTTDSGSRSTTRMQCSAPCAWGGRTTPAAGARAAAAREARHAAPRRWWPAPRRATAR